MSHVERSPLATSAHQLIDAIHEITNGRDLEDVLNALIYVLAETLTFMQRELDEVDAVETAIEALRGNSADMLTVQSLVQ